MIALGFALQTTMIAYGLLQEIVSNSALRLTSTPLPPSLFVLTNRVGTAAVAWLGVRCARRKRKVSIMLGDPNGVKGSLTSVRRSAALSAAATTIDGILRYKVLTLVPFAWLLVLRGLGVFPNLLFGWLLSSAPSRRDVGVAACVAIGVAMFGFDSLRGLSSSGGPSLRDAALGISLALLAVCADAFNAQWQARIFRTHKVTSLELMLQTSAMSAAFAAGVLLLSGEALGALSTLLREPLCLIPILAMSFSVACGTVVIFEVLQRYGGFTLAVMSIVRRLLSVTLSTSLFASNAHLTAWQMLGLATVFCSLFLRAVLRKSSSSVIVTTVKKLTVNVTRNDVVECINQHLTPPNSPHLVHGLEDQLPRRVSVDD
jgi:hypothetical protein